MPLTTPEDDATGCRHDWQVPLRDGSLGSPDEEHRLEDAAMAWCRVCGSLLWGKTTVRGLLVPGLKQLEMWGMDQRRRRRPSAESGLDS